jgi:uncharacterized protein YjeT (DUF2065 family)
MAAVVLGLRLALGVIFVVTGSATMLALGAFTRALRDYKLLPESAVRVTAVVLSAAELACRLPGAWRSTWSVAARSAAGA